MHGRTWLSAVSVHTASQDISTSLVVSVLHFWFVFCFFLLPSQVWILMPIPAQGWSEQQTLKSHRWNANTKRWQRCQKLHLILLKAWSPCLQAFLLWGTEVGALHYSGQIEAIQGFLWVTLLLIKFITVFAIDFKATQISRVLDSSFWCKSFAVDTAQPTLPCYSSWMSDPGKSHRHPFFVFSFLGALDRACLMHRAPCHR